MKLRKALFIAVISSICFANNTIAQNGFKDYEWTEAAKKTELPAQYNNEDAVYTMYEHRFAVAQDWSTYYTVHSKVKILTKKGLEKYARIILNDPHDYAYLETVDARTIKANGQVVDLNAKDIKRLKFKNNDLTDETDFLIFPIPGVEIGDEVEMLSVMRNEFVAPYFFVQQGIPIIKAQYSLRLPKLMTIDLLVYNGMPQPIVAEKGDFNTYTWIMDTLPGYGDDVKSVKTLTVPFVLQNPKGGKSFSLAGDVYDWKDFLGRLKKIPVEESAYTIEQTTKGVLKHLTQTLHADTSIATRLMEVQAYLNDSTTARWTNSKEDKNGISGVALCKVYMDVFDELKIPYYLILARNKYNGPFDYKIAEWVQVDECMFAFKDEKGGLGIISPRNSWGKYQLNEVDVRFQRTDAITINATDLAVGRLMLPASGTNDNNRIRRAQMSVNLDKMNVGGKIQETFRGGFSTYYRSNYLKHSKDEGMFSWMKELMKERNEKITVDTAFMQNMAKGTDNQFKVMYNVNIPNSVTVLDQKLYSISMDKWFWHAYDPIQTDKRSLDYYPLLSGSDMFRYYLVFDHKVELVNKSNIDLNSTYPEYGMYKLSAVQVDPNTILVESNFTLSGKPIPVNDLSKFAEIKRAIEKADNEQLIVKVVD